MKRNLRVVSPGLPKNSENLLEQTDDLLHGAARTKQIRNRAQQVPQQSASRIGRDVQQDRIEMHDQAKQIEIDWPELEVKNLTYLLDDHAARRGAGVRRRESERHSSLRDDEPRLAGRCLQRAAHGPDCINAVAIARETLNREIASERRDVGCRAGDRNRDAARDAGWGLSRGVVGAKRRDHRDQKCHNRRPYECHEILLLIRAFGGA
jgi:hypothetical protein